MIGGNSLRVQSCMMSISTLQKCGQMGQWGQAPHEKPKVRQMGEVGRVPIDESDAPLI